MNSKDIQVLIPGSFVTLYGKSKFADIIKEEKYECDTKGEEIMENMLLTLKMKKGTMNKGMQIMQL